MLSHWKMRTICGGALAAAALLAPATALATGPVSAAAVPGTVTVTDSDSGNGQSWGRAGGRNLAFTVVTPAAFSALTWGVANGTNPSLAFDGAVTASTTEVMSYTPGQSTATAARWTGSALLVVNGTTYNVPTRFTLTFSNSAGTPSVAFDTGGVSPGTSLLVPGQVHVNELFEMQNLSAWGGDNTFRPVLDLYDALPTPPGQGPQTNTGPVMTGVTTGFYYTTAVAGLTLEQHDANITNQLNAIKGDTSFIRTDMTGRFDQVMSDLGTVKNSVGNGLFQTISQIGSQVSQLVNNSQSGGGNTATRDDINGLQQMLMVFWGVMPCPQNFGPQCPGVRKIQDLATEANVNDVKSTANGILIGMNQLATASSVSTLSGNVTDVKNTASGILIGLNQLATASSVSTLSGKVDALQSALTAAQNKIGTLQDMIDNGTSFAVTTMLLPAVQKQVRWLVGTTRGGVSFNPSSVKVSAIFGATSPATVRDITGNTHITTIAPGLHDIAVDVVKGVSDGDAYVIEVGLVENGITLKGGTLVSSATK